MVDLLCSLESSNDMGHTTFQVLTERRQKLFDYPTAQEILFRSRLNRGKIKYQFQVIIPPYIVDFLIPKRRLIIELDGSHHQSPEMMAYDERRTGYLRARGFVVIRIPNGEVANWPLRQIHKYPKAKGCLRVINNLIEQYKANHGSVKRTVMRAQSRIVKARLKRKCHVCGSWAFLFDGELGPHLMSGKGESCPLGIN